MNKHISLLLITTLLSFITVLNAGKIDSLQTLLDQAEGKTKTEILEEIGLIYMDFNMDSCFFYLELAKKHAVKNNEKKIHARILRAIGKANAYLSDLENAIYYTNQALEEFIEIGDEYNITLTYNNIGIFNSMNGDDENAILYHKKALMTAEKLKDTVEIVETLNNIGTSFYHKAEYDSALYYLNYAENLIPSIKNIRTIGAVKNNYGLIYQALGQLEKAINTYLEALEYFEQLNDQRAINYINNNIGSLYVELGFYQKAIRAFKIKAKADHEFGNYVEYLNAYNNIGICYSNLGYQDSALIVYKIAAEIVDTLDNNEIKGLIFKNLGDTYYILEDYAEALKYLKKAELCRMEDGNPFNLSRTYNSLGDVYMVMGDYTNAYKYLKKSEEISFKLGAYQAITEALYSMAELFYKMGKFKQSAEYYNMYVTYNDSMMSESVKQQISDLETKYQTEKKEQQLKLKKAEILQKEEQLAREEAESQRNAAQRNIVIIGLGLMILLVFVVFRSYRQKKKANIIIREKNDILEQANEEIAAQRDEIEAQRDLAAQQRDLIAEQKQDITDSIQYAFKIQSAIFPDHNEIEKILEEYFILYKPRDIVSGDFYWITKQNNRIVIIAADCTGHGVPGAFMSMLGVAFLNDIVNKEKIIQPAAILNRLRENVIYALKQQGMESEQQDGMDVAAITIDPVNLKMEFAGANNPLYYIRNKELIEVKGDKMPVSVYVKMQPFTNHVQEISKGDVIYIFSDGYADQFGGEKGKKFKYANFKELLLKNANRSMAEQEEILAETFEKWKGNYDQIDDVLIVGIKI